MASSQHVCSFEGCFKSFSKPSRLLHHIRTHTGERPYACGNCSRTYTRSAHLRRHEEQAHCDVSIGTTVKCTEAGCREVFSSNQNLKKHIKRKHQRVHYKCLDCGATFAKHRQLTVHQLFHQTALPYICTVEGCSKAYSKNSRLQRHIKSHEGYRCTHEGCNQWMEKWSMLRQHLAHSHKPVLNCSECSRTFVNQGQLDCHLMTHSGTVKVFQCPREGCSRYYAHEKNLTKHLATHHEGQLFPCTEDKCTKSFSTKQKLQQHMVVHKGSKRVAVKHEKPVKKSLKRSMASKLSGYIVGKSLRQSAQGCPSSPIETSTATHQSTKVCASSDTVLDAGIYQSAQACLSRPTEIDNSASVTDSNVDGTALKHDTPLGHFQMKLNADNNSCNNNHMHETLQSLSKVSDTCKLDDNMYDNSQSIMC